MPSPSKLRSSLERNGVDAAVMEQVYQGFEAIEDKSPKKVKAVFMRHAMKVLDDNLPYERRYEILDGCACCLGGSREQKVKRFLRDIADESHTLAEKVERLRQARPFYNSTRLNADGTITDGVYYQVDGEYHCACTMFTKEKIDEPISSTYCLCCAGHFRHHLQKALGLKLRTVRVASSPLESLGKEPCEFVFEDVRESPLSDRLRLRESIGTAHPDLTRRVREGRESQ